MEWGIIFTMKLDRKSLNWRINDDFFKIPNEKKTKKIHRRKLICTQYNEETSFNIEETGPSKIKIG